eukprot:TRINITY_DN5962_c1_g2_i3.p1 TRINITY_DN5962_c1_g2~~TRINITY_DN5962_c1_g2_i3.p1  ORF type:complete len:895 (+),score=147.96 TRINITY_DN5962_c1_g2_i3:23-2686(+)
MDPDHRGDNDDVLVKITTFTGVVVALNVPSAITVMEIRKTLQHYAECCYITQYALVTKDGTTLNDVYSLGQQGKGKGPHHLSMVFTPYSYTGMRDHILQIRDLHGQEAEEFALTCASPDETGQRDDPLSYPPISRNTLLYSMLPSDEGAELCEAFGTQAGILTEKNCDFEGVLQTVTLDTPKTPQQPLVSMSMATPLPLRRLRGDLCYFTVSYGKQTWGIAGTHAGFHIIASHDFSDTTKAGEVYQTLFGLLYHVIPGQAERYEDLIKSRIMHTHHDDYAVFPTQQWLEARPEIGYKDAWRCKEYEHSITWPQDPRFSQRNWCTQWVAGEAGIDQVFGEFVAVARQSVVLAVDGSLTASEVEGSFDDQVFFFNGIALTFCKETSTKNNPSWTAARKDILFNKKLALFLSKENIYSLPTCCVDYHGYRAWCVGVSFEIFDKHGLSKLAYRQEVLPDLPMDQEKTRVMLSSIFEKNSLSVHIPQGDFNTSLYEGRDGRMYVEATHGVMAKKHDGKILRSELYEKYNSLLRKCEEGSVSSCGTNEVSSDTTATVVDAVVEKEITLESTLHGQIDQLVKDLTELTISLGDSAALTKTFHDRGVPMSSLGTVYERITPSHPDSSRLLWEGILRSAKKEFRALVKPLRTGAISAQIATFLNDFFSKEETGLKRRIQSRVETHFELPYDTAWRSANEACWYMLRGLCLKVGLVIVARQFDWNATKIFKKSDINDLVAVVYRCSPASNRNDEETEIQLCFEQAVRSNEMRDEKTMTRALTQMVLEIGRRAGWDTPQLIAPLHSLALAHLRLASPSISASLYARAANIGFLSCGSSSIDYTSSVLNYAVCALKTCNISLLLGAQEAVEGLSDASCPEKGKYLAAFEQKIVGKVNEK